MGGRLGPLTPAEFSNICWPSHQATAEIMNDAEFKTMVQGYYFLFSEGPSIQSQPQSIITSF
jgi:hypothetical protein